MLTNIFDWEMHSFKLCCWANWCVIKFIFKFILNTDPCESFPCKNGGKCSSENGKWKCDCISKYFGSTCENKRNPCQEIPINPCFNGGTCVPTSDNAISCSCQSGFQGALCKEKQDEKDKEEEADDNKGV